jgi:hypothetical protein
MESWPGLQAKTPADDLRLDLGATTEPLMQAGRLAQASSASRWDVMLNRTSSDGTPRPCTSRHSCLAWAA